MSRKWILVAVLAGLAGVLAVAALRKGDARALEENWPVDFAHRGASARLPENTLEAFRAATEAGAGGLELDVHATRDGRIVVIHDDAVNRTTDGSGGVRGMTLAEVRGLDAGHRFSPDGVSYPYRGRGLKVPTLAEVLREFPRAAVNAEIKEDRPGIEEAVLRVIREADAEERVLVVAEDHAVVGRFREISGGRVSTGASRREICAFYLLSRLRLEWLLRPRYDALQVPVSYGGIPLITPRFVEAAHGRGVRVDAWTVDEPGEMRRLLDFGADVIMTNRPETLAEVLKERKGCGAATGVAGGGRRSLAAPGSCSARPVDYTPDKESRARTEQEKP